MTAILIFVAGLCPVLGIFCSLAHFSKSRNALSAALVLGFASAGLLYGYVADAGNDIYRHILNLNYYRGIPLPEAFDAGKLSNVYTWDIWSWLMAKTSNGYLLQASGALVGYTLLSYCAYKYANRANLNLKQYLLMLLLCISIVPPLDIAVGIRNANAFIICFFAIYSFYFEKRNYFKCIILFMIAIFLHHAAVLLFLVWLVMPIYKKNKLVVSIVTVIVLFTFTNYGDYMSRLMGGGSIVSGLLADTMYSAYSYQSDIATSFHSLFTRYFQMLFTFVLIVRGYKKTEEDNDENDIKARSLWEMSIFLFVISVCLVVLLGSNGNRYFIFTSLLAFIPFVNKVTKDGFLVLNQYFLMDFLTIGCSLGHIALYLYNMSWGTGDIRSLLLSSLIGFFSRL